MPAVKVVDLPYSAHAETLFERFRDLADPVWLDSGKPGSLPGKFDIISAAPLTLLEPEKVAATQTESGSGNPCTNSYTNATFQLAADLLKEMAVPPRAGVPFCGGLLGYFSYAFGRHLLAQPNTLADPVGLPTQRLGFYTWALVINHQMRRAYLVFHPACDKPLRVELVARANAPRRRGSNDFRLTTPFAASLTKDAYLTQIAKIQDYIKAGDCYQVNFAQHFAATYAGDAWHAYRHLRRLLPSPFSAFLNWQDNAILSFSPERFVKLSGQQVEAKPIKGTVARGRTMAEDQANALALLNSAKDRAENLMIVDLLRNDLGKNCRPGSIRVPKLFDLESFANVHHLVSTVTGTLASGKSALDLLAGCFPGGSITGAPKRRAMEIIEETELVQRSIYCGSIGYVSACGRMDTNIAIRTLAASAGKLHCWGGGGIVADSQADNEYAESLNKIGLLMTALEACHPG